jgi:hypothetical protein
MIVLLLGFRESLGEASAEPLYLGPDASAAIGIQEDPPEGIVRTHLYQGLPEPTRRRYHEAAPAAAAVPVPAAEPEPEPAPRRGRPPKSAAADSDD